MNITNDIKSITYFFILLVPLTLFGCNGDGGDGSNGSANIPPVAHFTATPDIGSFPLTISFNASASTDSDGSIDQYQWDFGDGTSGSGMSIQHVYQTIGQFTATLTITDNNNLSDTNTHVIDVKPRYTLSGSVMAATNLAMDSDVNDYNAAYASNDSFADAQPIPVPVTLSGYVNIADAGENGRFKQNGDSDDYYQASLAAGMTVSFYMVEDPDSSNLNLYLYDGNQTLVDSSITFGDTVDTVTAPSDSTFFIRVEADGGGTIPERNPIYSKNWDLARQYIAV